MSPIERGGRRPRGAEILAFVEFDSGGEEHENSMVNPGLQSTWEMMDPLNLAEFESAGEELVNPCRDREHRPAAGGRSTALMVDPRPANRERVGWATNQKLNDPRSS